MDVFEFCASNTSYGCLMMESLIGKVGTSATGGVRYGNLSLLRFVLSGSVEASLWSGYPTHTPVDLGAPTNNSPAVKVLPYQISNNGQGSIGFQANELTWRALSISDVDGTTAKAFVAGEVYRVTEGNHSGLLIHCNVDVNVTLDSYYIVGGKIANGNGAALSQLGLYDGSHLSWGDDSTIKVTADGSDTFVDLNGNSNLSVVHELAIPYTWTSNHARAGSQVKGVDL